MWTPLVVLGSIIVVSSIILWILVKINKIDKKNIIYRLLKFLFIILPGILVIFYYTYLVTDTSVDWFIASWLILILFGGMYLLEFWVEKKNDINYAIVLISILSIYVLANAINVLLLNAINNLEYIFSLGIIGIVTESKRNYGKLTVVAIAFIIVLGIGNFILSDKLDLDSKPIRIAKEYALKKGYDLEKMEELEFSSSKTRKAPIELIFVNEDYSKSVKLEYYKGEIQSFKLENSN
ncbi:hypothetical protein GOQ27_10585 [Clostridium sp. D2Q-11]|uniref:Uncharacterized protein n=1 Tax=Anaeromonas frigoriresistens TaxID=2683708 RepID=A0A942Z9A4_9FIRM|nr:hypothetical protein [Anaeromonas frigoriresistens]MBS4538914.1 hypothetical protein [Anaeromonas frigoriresistens]